MTQKKKVISKGKAATLIGVVISAIGAVVTNPDVQAIVPSEYAPYIQLLGTIIAAVGPSLTRSAKATQRSTD